MPLGQLLKAFMARVKSDNGILVTTIAFGASAIVVSIVAWALIDGIRTDRNHAERLTAIEASTKEVLNSIDRRLTNIENELGK